MATKSTAKAKTRKAQKPKTSAEKKKTQSRKTDSAYTFTHDGHRLTPKENKFIDLYIELGNATEAVVQAGYNSKTPHAYANMLLRKNYIAGEIKFRTEQIHTSKIATAKEVMEYFTSVMKGEIKDQFGLEAPLSERTRAAQELAKRTVDIDNRLAGKADAEVKITLDWGRIEE